jgi:hypothetical protein
MKHLEKAKEQLDKQMITAGGEVLVSEFIRINGSEISFKIQDGPIGEAGVNGLQVTDMVRFCTEVYKSLNDQIRCRENALTITKLEEAVLWQGERTRNRQLAGIEGTMKG